jgi:hypothetical protein
LGRKGETLNHSSFLKPMVRETCKPWLHPPHLYCSCVVWPPFPLTRKDNPTYHNNVGDPLFHFSETPRPWQTKKFCLVMCPRRYTRFSAGAFSNEKKPCVVMGKTKWMFAVLPVSSWITHFPEEGTCTFHLR